MKQETLKLLICPECSNSLTTEVFHFNDLNYIIEGLLCCEECKSWYPISKGVANLLPKRLANTQSRMEFQKKWNFSLENTLVEKLDHSISEKRKQIDFFNSETEGYVENMENTSFWMANDWNCLRGWLPLVNNDQIILDIGCGTGRASFPFIKKGVNAIGLDISDNMVYQAKKKSDSLGLSNKVDYIIGDSENLPFKNESFDAVIAFGVLHHVPNPQIMLQQIANCLKENGFYFGHENNDSILRPIFDLMMKISKLWEEEAGDHPLISKMKLAQWAEIAGLSLEMRSSVFIPPHLLNIFNANFAKLILSISDFIFNNLKLTNNLGGILVIKGRKNF